MKPRLGHIAVLVALTGGSAAPAAGAPVNVLRDGEVTVVDDPTLPPGDPLAAVGALARPYRSAAPAAGARSFLDEVTRLEDLGQIEADRAQEARSTYTRARATVRRLSGRREVELGGVLRTVDGIALRGELTSSRLEPLVQTIERNRQWWTTGSLLPYGARVQFAGSEVIWQSEPGQGIQLHPLANWGRVNGAWMAGDDEQLRRQVDDLLPLAARRGGAPVWEYYFWFGGGAPPWTSGLSQGTAVQALTRASIRLGDPELAAIARAGLRPFTQPPPTGVRVRTSRGNHYLIYSFAPKLRVFNAFVQAVNGLHDVADGLPAGPGRRRAEALSQSGLTRVRYELPRADTGSWSRYSLRGPLSSYSYHVLLRDFLLGLCERTEDDLVCRTGRRFTGYLTRAQRADRAR